MHLPKRTLAATVSALGLAFVSSGCGVVGSECSGLGAIVCGIGLYCHYEPGVCGENEAVGVCAERPEICTEIFAPVCGCDGETYANECFAASAGTSVRSTGACPGDGDEQICGGLTGFPCDEGEFCQFPEGTCGAADETGVCKEIPDACTLEFAPVCGCDEQTYGNQCAADIAEVSILHDGECEGGDEQICGGLTGAPCDEGEFCQFPAGTCGAADETGVCTDVPDVCTEEFAPVCGCDEQTYGNQCEADRAEISILHEGECDDDIEARVCGGIAGEPCDEGEFCRLPEGQCCCDFQGICEVLPVGCTDEVDPVCGCDARTYFNECEAAAAGVSIDHQGECP